MEYVEVDNFCFNPLGLLRSAGVCLQSEMDVDLLLALGLLLVLKYCF